MQQLLFSIQGSASEPYEVRIVRRDEHNVSAYCTCPAGEHGLVCKHRIGILAGHPEGLVNGNPADVETVLSWIRGSDIELAIGELHTAETQLELLKTEIAKLKRKLAHAMLD